MIKAIVFDLDDTIYPEWQFVSSGFSAVDLWLKQINIIREGFYEIAWHYYSSGYRGNIFNLALDEMGIRYDDDLINQMVEKYRRHQPLINMHNDARWAINFFRGKAILGIITDGYYEVQKNKVKALGLDQEMNIIIYTDQFGRNNWKPSKTPFEKFMYLANLRGEECIYIGDNVKKDFIAANLLHWKTIHVIRKDGEYANAEINEKKYEAMYVVRDLYETRQIIEPEIIGERF
ncbi:MAG: HAD family hydrolase [Ignavibacterium sp.]|nr:HAD family hydrolase [Ignavibacterium sp.]